MLHWGTQDPFLRYFVVKFLKLTQQRKKPGHFITAELMLAIDKQLQPLHLKNNVQVQNFLGSIHPGGFQCLYR